MTTYLVTGNLPFRRHQPGETFQANLDPAAEIRAIKRGNIRVVNSSPTRLRPGSWRLPDGWQTQADDGAPTGALFSEGSK